MPSSLFRLPILCLAMAGLTAPLLGQSQPSLDNDFVVPSPAQMRARATAVRVLAKAAGEGERVAYTAFNGNTYELTRYHGRYVDVLLPDSWTSVLSIEQIRAFADRVDWIYQYFLDLVGAPPNGEGPLPVAIVPDVCGGALGCANLGYKGVEMLDHPQLNPLAWQEIDTDSPSGILIHELTHNFDLFSPYVAATPDSAHAWTSFLTYYYAPYAREGLMFTPYEEIVKDWQMVTARYFQDPGADWGRCVRDGQCEEDRLIAAELAWGGLGFRFGLLDGPRAVHGFLAFLLAYRQAHEPPETAEEKNDLLLEAMSAGAGHNMSCVADAWHWPLSASLRERLSGLYGPSNPDCQDRDRDGFNAIQGDCDDRQAGIHPGAAERLRRVDDDCDGRVDERVWREPPGRDFAAPPTFALPDEATGDAGGVDADEFLFRLRAPTRMWFEACSFVPAGGGLGAVLLFDPTERRQIFYVNPGSCTWQVYTLDPGNWRALISIAGEAGDSRYSLTVQNAPPWPPVPWARTAVPRKRGGQFILTATSTLPRPPGPGAQVRFWVSGQGIVGTVPYRTASAFTWQPPPGVDPVAAGLTYRAQLFIQGVPAAVISRPQAFAAR